jgi:hypothetical protein
MHAALPPRAAQAAALPARAGIPHFAALGVHRARAPHCPATQVRANPVAGAGRGGKDIAPLATRARAERAQKACSP